MRYSGLVIIISFLIIFSTSCRDENSTAGENWVDNTIHSVISDTCTVHLLTIIYDSIATSGNSIFQLGHFADEYRGDIRSSFFVELNTNTTVLGEETNYLLDSLTFVLKYDGEFLGDTLTPQKVNLHKLTEIIELNDNGYLFNHSTVPYEEEPLASHIFYPRPLAQDDEIGNYKVEFRLPDEMGQELLDKMTIGADELSTQDHFREYLKGFAIIPENTDKCITGFSVGDSSVYMKLYYRADETTVTYHTAHFAPSSSLNFTNIEYDKTGTPFESLESGIDNALLSYKTDNIAVLQGLTGTYIKVEFPYLNNMLMEGHLVCIENAILYLYPARGTYSEDSSPLPENLTLYTTDHDEVIEDVITDYLGSSQTGNLITDDISNKGTYYTFDITSFLQSNLGAIGSGRKNLQLMLPDDEFFTTVNNIIIGDSDHAENNVKVEILYTIYKK